jgi:PAS domain S-box-containing protein
VSHDPSDWSLNPSYSDLRGAIDTLNAGLIVRTAHGKLLYANERVLEWVGYAREELDGQDFRMLLPPELHDDLPRELEEIIAGDERARIVVVQRKNGRTFPVVACPHVLRRDGQVQAVVGLFFDIGELTTARRVGTSQSDGVAGNLERIALELQTISLFSGPGHAPTAIHEYPEFDQLSVREREILAELITGSRVPAIAKDLFISPHTVRNHLKSMYRKLDVSSQAELIEFVRRVAKN